MDPKSRLPPSRCRSVFPFSSGAYDFLILFISRFERMSAQYSWQGFMRAGVDAAKITCYIILILVGAKIMGTMLANLGAFDAMSKWVTALSMPRLGILLIIILMYLVLGCFMSGLAAIVITLPIVFPIIMTLGYDPIWFGVVIVLMNECGMLTPPVGNLLYLLQGLCPDTPFRVVAMGCLPFVIVILVETAILIAVPQIATWLPTLMLG